MEELSPNPEGCQKFEPNQFKKEKCKSCGFLWAQHKGVISDEIVQGFLKAKQKVVDDKAKKEAEEKSAAQAKKLAKKKQNQAADDEWLFDGHAAEDAASKTTADDDSDDDFGFRMFSPAELAVAGVSSRSGGNPGGSRQLKITNLIDWGECDVPDEQEETPPAPAETIEASHGPAMSSFAEVPVVASGNSTGLDLGLRESRPSVPSVGASDHLEEIQYLRERLATAEEEKQIQVEIVRDEVKEKQQQVDDLTKQTADLQAQLKEARARIEEMSDELDNVRSSLKREEAESQQNRSEVERLRASVLEVEARLEAKTAESGRDSFASAADSAEAQPLQAPQAAETEQQHSAAEAQPQQAQEADQLRSSETSASCEAGLPASGDGSSAPAPEAEQMVEKARLRCEKQVAKAVRDIRVSVEQQLAWFLHAQSTRLKQQAVPEHLEGVAASSSLPEADEDELLKLDDDVAIAPSLPKADDDDDQLLL
eukprot:TRINITY_DN31293_c0_g1_i1.p1 TRINITY_DN31293_c0_g1~~TRINITY_DN31293_c0_g1_i1.p1  ORF type:complete len:482 (+),score=171.36 TRINITY_DN31293_c0_g1_i1:56-1501(+)